MATQRTTEEFLQSLLQSSNEALARHRPLLAEFLQQCDFVKFAGTRLAVADMEALFQSARAFVFADRRVTAGTMIRFLQPEWFWAFALLPLSSCGEAAADRSPPSNIPTSVSRATLRAAPAAGSAELSGCCRSVAAALMIVGLARPQRTHSRTEVTANGIDIVLGLDVSGSMQALDFLVNNHRVNRIAVVKSVVARFIDERPNDRIGLIAFAGSPYIVSPLTLDHDWLAPESRACQRRSRRRTAPRSARPSPPP